MSTRDSDSELIKALSTNASDSMALLKEKALEAAGLTYDEAFAIDESNIGERVGEYYITLIVEKFFEKVYSDENEYFRLFLILLYYSINYHKM